MNILDNVAVIIMIPIITLISFAIGTLVRATLIRDEYKYNIASIITNCIMGIVAIVIIHSAIK